MVARVLIIGGYGNFGSHIARSLAGDVAIRLLISGRSVEKAQAFAASLEAFHPAEGHALNIDGSLAAALARLEPDIVVHKVHLSLASASSLSMVATKSRASARSR